MSFQGQGKVYVQKYYFTRHHTTLIRLGTTEGSFVPLAHCTQEYLHQCTSRSENHLVAARTDNILLDYTTLVFMVGYSFCSHKFDALRSVSAFNHLLSEYLTDVDSRVSGSSSIHRDEHHFIIASLRPNYQAIHEILSDQW